MIKLTRQGVATKVSFVVPQDASVVGVAGEFNGWNASSLPFKKRGNGTKSAVTTLAPGRTYQFRYVTDDGRWIDDEAAHAYVDNGHGSTNSVVAVDG